MTVEREVDVFRVKLGTDLEFLVPRDLLGLLRGVRTRTTDYLHPGSAGLMIRYRDNIPYRAGGFGPYGAPTQAGVAKAGPLAARLVFRSTEALRGGRSVASVVIMEFSRFKSWVRVTWVVDDPNSYVAGLGADVNLNLQGEPALVDFGAGSLVYAQLRKGEAALLRAGSGTEGPIWETLTGRAGALTPYVIASRGPHAAKAEGWAHVMDRQRCTAIAVERFADAGQESEIRVAADGRLQIWKAFARDGASVAPGTKRFTFWLHFVPMPVQVGAATSPQAMLTPLRAELKAGAP
jgi:hypothetical protein